MSKQKLNFGRLPYHVAIIGSRSFEDYCSREMKIVIDKFVSRLKEGTIVTSGGARGIDKYAETSATKRGLGFVSHYPKEAEHRSYVAACFARNTEIVQWAAKNSGIVIAFVDPLQCNGTNDTIKKAASVPIPWIRFSYDRNAQALDHDGSTLYFDKETE